MRVGLYSVTYSGVWYRGPALSAVEFITRAKECAFQGGGTGRQAFPVLSHGPGRPSPRAVAKGVIWRTAATHGSHMASCR